MKLSELQKNPGNPRAISDKKRAMLKKAMLRFGDLSGIIFNRKSKQLAGGHQRQDVFEPDTVITIVKKYAKPTKTGTIAEGFVELKGERFAYREVWWNEQTEKAANIAANKGAGEWDIEKLSEWMKGLSSFDSDFDMDLTMFDADELLNFQGITVKEHTRTGATGVDEDDVPEKAPARSKLGDVYLLGFHRVVCGDCTDEAVVAKALEGKLANAIWTDPPYNVNYEGKTRDALKIMNDKMGDNDFRDFLLRAFSAVASHTANGSAFYVAHADSEGYNFRGAVRDAGLTTKQCLIWKKSSLVMGRQDYHWIHEPILYGWKEGASHHWYNDRKQTTVLEFARPSSSKLHPTMKPVELVQYCLENSTKEGDVVFDGFGGSGTTLIACEKLKRRCTMVELDPSYVDVIVERWEKYTGLKAKLIRAETVRKPASQARSRERATSTAAKA